MSFYSVLLCSSSNSTSFGFMKDWGHSDSGSLINSGPCFHKSEFWRVWTSQLREPISAGFSLVWIQSQSPVLVNLSIFQLYIWQTFWVLLKVKKVISKHSKMSVHTWHFMNLMESGVCVKLMANRRQTTDPLDSIYFSFQLILEHNHVLTWQVISRERWRIYSLSIKLTTINFSKFIPLLWKWTF